jgi:uncharacterized membrane protein YkoI
MMKCSFKILLLALTLGAATNAMAGKFDLGELLGQVQAVAVEDSTNERIIVAAQSNGPTLSQAVEMVKRQYKGRIVSAETKTSGNREVHHIKVLTEDGKVKTVQIAGRSKRP